jgi:TolB-like protein/tetratricopeptide (TPR) repeat protein
MADVFISYAREDEARALSVARAVIAAGYEAWWDTHLPVHRVYSTVIEENLAAAKAVLVLWSEAAVQSDWVRAEAEVARAAKKLVQVALDDALPPLPFNQFQCADLADWSGAADDPQWRKVLAGLSELTGRPSGDAGAAPASAPSAMPHTTGLPLELPAKPSIAVLPFLNMSGDREQEYFADAVSEDIITALSRWRWFFVIARNSSFAYKGASIDVARVGRELGVRYVLEGSVRKVGERVRVNAQLVEAASATHIWAETFDRDLAHLLDMQDEITEQVVAAIEPAMRQSEGARLARKPLADLSALDCFQRGMWRLNKTNWHLEGGTRDDYHEALALFRKAIALDPDLPLGYVGLARVLYGGAIYGWTEGPRDDLAASRDAARTAIGLDPRDALAHFAAAGASLYLGEHAAALDEARRTIALNSNFGFGHFRLGQVLLYGGRPAEAIAPFERSLRFSPFDPQLGAMHRTLAFAYFHAGNYDAAVEQAKFALYLGHARAVGVLTASLVKLGRIDEAVREIERAPHREGATRGLPEPYADPADAHRVHEAVDAARQAAAERATAAAAAGHAAS